MRAVIRIDVEFETIMTLHIAPGADILDAVATLSGDRLMFFVETPDVYSKATSERKVYAFSTGQEMPDVNLFAYLKTLVLGADEYHLYTDNVQF